MAHRGFWGFHRSERVNDCEASENVEARQVTRAGLLVHTFQYGHFIDGHIYLIREHLINFDPGRPAPVIPICSLKALEAMAKVYARAPAS